MKKYITKETNLTTAPHKASIQKSPALDSFILTGDVNGTITEGAKTAQLIRALFDGSVKPSDVALKLSKNDVLEDSNFKDRLILSCPTESESVQTVCNPEDIRESASYITNGAQIIMNGEDLSC